MRLWSIHPSYLDKKGLLRLWNEGLIAARAMEGLMHGEKRGYQEHPQLLRFKEQPAPLQAICDYMHIIAQVAHSRDYSYPDAFHIEKLPLPFIGNTCIPVTAGQMEFEVWHYGQILVRRRGNRKAYVNFWSIAEHEPHPCFVVVPGAIARWEKLSGIYVYTNIKPTA